MIGYLGGHYNNPQSIKKKMDEHGRYMITKLWNTNTDTGQGPLNKRLRPKINKQKNAKI